MSFVLPISLFQVDIVSEEDEEEDVTPLPSDKYKPASLEKMITLIAILVEKSRGLDRNLQLSTLDFNAFAGGKGFPFLYQQIKDCINLQQTRNLINSLCRWNDRLAQHIVGMIFQAIMKHSEVNKFSCFISTLLPLNTLKQCIFSSCNVCSCIIQ